MVIHKDVYNVPFPPMVLSKGWLLQISHSFLTSHLTYSHGFLISFNPDFASMLMCFIFPCCYIQYIMIQYIYKDRLEYSLISCFILSFLAHSFTIHYSIQALLLKIHSISFLACIPILTLSPSVSMFFH